MAVDGPTRLQSEIIEMFAHSIQREIVAQALESPFFGLTADGTTDHRTIFM